MSLWVLLKSLQNVDFIILAGNQYDGVLIASSVSLSVGSSSNVNLVFKAFVMLRWVYSIPVPLWA